MRTTFLTFCIYYLGALMLWVLAGFKGNISNYMPRPYEQSKRSINALVAGSITTFLLLALGFKIYGYYQSTQPYVLPGLTPAQTKEFIEKTNGTGKIAVRPEQIDEFLSTLDSIKNDSLKQ